MSDDIHQAAIKTAEYLYGIEGDTYDGEVEAISMLRKLINEEFVGKGKSVSSQLIYDIMHPVIDQALTAYKKELLSRFSEHFEADGRATHAYIREFISAIQEDEEKDAQS